MTIVRNAAHVQELRVREELRIGVVEGEEPYQFYQIRDLTEDRTGRIFVGNGRTATVRVYDSEGTFLDEFGGRGDGPSEFTMVNDLFLADSNVVVVDWQAGGRAAVFTPQGALVDSWRGRWAGAIPTAWTTHGWLGIVYSRPSPDIATLRPGDRVEERSILHWVEPPPTELGPPAHALPARWLYYSAPIKWLDWPLFRTVDTYALDDQGRLFSYPGSGYSIEVRTNSGDLEMVIRRDHAPRLITDEDVQTYRRLMEQRMRGDGAPSEQLKMELARVDEQGTFPTVTELAPVGEILVSRAGVVWVRREDTRSAGEVEFDRMSTSRQFSSVHPETWEVFEANGAYRGTATFPARFTVLAVSDRRATGVLRDELDIEYIVRYTLATSDG